MLRPVLCRPVLRVRCVLHELIEMIIAQKIMLRKQQKRIDPSSRMHRREHVGNIPFFAHTRFTPMQQKSSQFSDCFLLYRF